MYFQKTNLYLDVLARFLGEMGGKFGIKGTNIPFSPGLSEGIRPRSP